MYCQIIYNSINISFQFIVFEPELSCADSILPTLAIAFCVHIYCEYLHELLNTIFVIHITTET